MNRLSELDPSMLREAYGQFPSGIAAIAAVHEGVAHVIVASSFSVGVSLSPPLAAFYVQNASSTWHELSRLPRLGVSILSVEHAAICRQLASRDKASRFRNVQTSATAEGALRVSGASVWFDCSVFAVHPAGDHQAVQLLVHDLRLDMQTPPLVFHNSRFTRLEAQSICA